MLVSSHIITWESGQDSLGIVTGISERHSSRGVCDEQEIYGTGTVVVLLSKIEPWLTL